MIGNKHNILAIGLLKENINQFMTKLTGNMLKNTFFYKEDI